MDSNGRSLLAIAIARCDMKIALELLNNGADVCLKDSAGVSPLHLAMKCQKVEVSIHEQLKLFFTTRFSDIKSGFIESYCGQCRYF